MDILRSYFHFFLKHTKTKTDLKQTRLTGTIGRIFTDYDESLTVLLMMNNWTTWEMIAKGEKTLVEIGNRYRLYTKAEDASEEGGETSEEKKRKIKYRGWSKDGIVMYNKIVYRMRKMKFKDSVRERQEKMEEQLFEEMKEKYGDKVKVGREIDDGNDSDSEIGWEDGDAGVVTSVYSKFDLKDGDSSSDENEE